MDILERVIPIGKKNAIHQVELASLLGVTPATAKIMVREARHRGLEILSGTQGYWFAKDDNERREFVSLLSKQAFTRLKTTKPIKSNLQEIKGQMSLSDAMGGVSEEVSNNEQE